MNNLERKKLEVQLIKVRAAKEDQELQIMEREVDIERLRANIKIQQDAEHELLEKLNK